MESRKGARWDDEEVYMIVPCKYENVILKPSILEVNNKREKKK
jgi:hypothetical protein